MYTETDTRVDGFERSVLFISNFSGVVVTSPVRACNTAVTACSFCRQASFIPLRTLDVNITPADYPGVARRTGPNLAILSSRLLASRQALRVHKRRRAARLRTERMSLLKDSAS